MWPKNTRRYLVQHVFNAIELEGMASVGPPLKSRHHIVLWRQHIYNFTLAFIAPLKAQQYIHFCHSLMPYATRANGVY